MRKTNNRKAFTIIELIIVIAVIGILAGVLIPTFISLDNKAKDAADKSLVTNINKLIATAKADDETINCLDDVFDKITSYSPESVYAQSKENEILFDSDSMSFILNKIDNVLEDSYRYFKIYDEVPNIDEQKYSIYLRNTDYSEAVNVKVGFDCGENVNIPVVSYTNAGEAQTVIIHTVNSDLNVNAPNDKVYHYGSTDDVYITAVDDSSYYDYSITKYISIAQGRLVLQESSDIQGIHVKSNNVIISTVDEKALPEITRESSVTSLAIQNVNENGDVKEESTISISGTTATIEGDVNPEIINPVVSEVETAKTDRDARASLMYDVCVGAASSADESDYFEHLTDALDTIKSAADTTQVKFYLQRDVVLTETYNVTQNQKASTVLYFQGHTIKGQGCAPFRFTGLKSAFYLYGPGDLIVEDSEYALELSVNYEVRLNNMHTIGKFNNVGTSYITVNGGVHSSCAFEGTGKYRIDSYDFVAKKEVTTTFDFDITSRINTYRNKISSVDGNVRTLIRLTTTEQTAHGWTKLKSANDSFTRYDSLLNMILYEDFASVSVQLLANYEEDVTSTSSKSITINLNKKTFTGSLNVKNCSKFTLNSGSSTSTYGGVMNLTNLKCKTVSIGKGPILNVDTATVTNTFTINGTSAKVTLNGGTYSKAFTVYGSSSSLTINGGTYSSTISIYGNKSSLTINGGTFAGTIGYGTTNTTYASYAVTVTINNGTFNNNLVKTGTLTTHKIYVNGGSYKNSTVYGTYDPFVDKTVYTTKTVSNRIVVVPIEE